MPKAIVWTAERNATLLKAREAGLPWAAVAERIGVGRNSVMEQGRRLGVPVGVRRPLVLRAAATPTLVSPAPSMRDRPPLRAGSAETWGLLVEMTPSLTGMAYPAG